MRTRAVVSIALLVVALTAGTIADRPMAAQPLMLGGYRVLAVDFHTHSSMWSDGGFTPWGLVLEAQHQGLDAIVVTAHNQVSDGLVAQRFARAIGGPIVITGEEVWAGKRFHLIAAGITDVVGFRQTAADAIDDIHRQGGIAIAAHPFAKGTTGWDDNAVQRLDGGEICHPEIFSRADGQARLEAFADRHPMAAIGSSDFHGFGPMGICRTYVFAAEASERGILDAVRAHRTVVFGAGDHVYGDPALLQFASRLRGRAPSSTARGTKLDWVSRITALLGFAGLLLL